MKFYEFNKNGYYALVCANNMYEAISYYSCEFEKMIFKENKPTELGKELTIELLINLKRPFKKYTREKAEETIEKLAKCKKPFNLVCEEELNGDFLI